MKYDELIEECRKLGLEVYEREQKISGLYQDGIIGISSRLKTSADKLCVLAEELGHYHTSTGDILDQSKTINRKQERQARKWGYEKLLPLEKLISAFQNGCTNKHEIAEFSGITEDFLDASLRLYKEQYGVQKKHECYLIFFDPLAIEKITDQK